MDGFNSFKYLLKEAEYALNSHSRDLVYESYGMAKMAYNLDAISKDQFYCLNDMLVKHGLNDPKNCKLD